MLILNREERPTKKKGRITREMMVRFQRRGRKAMVDSATEMRIKTILELFQGSAQK